MAGAECFPFVAGEAAVFTAPNPEGDGVNQDAAAAIPLAAERGVLALADGAGGQPAGNQASGLALQALQQTLLDGAHRGIELRHAILDGFERANNDVRAMGVGAATTLVAIEIQGRTLRPYHVGDSMILVVGGMGRRKLQTISHSPVGYAVEAGMLDEGEALHHDELHLISNIVGADDMRIEIGSPIELSPRDTVLLASDGLLDNLHLEEIIETIRKGTLEQVAGSLVSLCHERMQDQKRSDPSKPDDLSFILFRTLIGREPPEADEPVSP